VITQTPARERTAAAPKALDLYALARGYGAALVITLLVLLGALLGPSALTTGSTGAVATGVRLDVGWGYVLMAPVANVLDTLSVLTLGQHYAVLVTLFGVYWAWRILRPRRRLGVARRVAVEAGTATAAFLALLVFYAYGIVGPRPMAAILPTDPDVVVLDVHSHTEHSHDSRKGFDAEDRRAWHAAAGFDVAYIADHRTWQGYYDGAPANPALAGQGTVLLPAIEVKFGGKYASVLGEEWRYRSAVRGNHMDDDSLYHVLRTTGSRPTMVLTLPSGLGGVIADSPDSIGYLAVELNDASPRGLRQSRRDRAQLLRLADSLDLAPVAATNNHGWGRTAAAWTLMRIPGWQGLTPRQLERAIDRKLHAERRRASWVVERRVPWSGEDPASLAATLPAITWTMFGGMGPAERVSWLLWAWALTLLLTLMPPRRWPALARPRRRRDPSR
jgi:hypothetical protein